MGAIDPSDLNYPSIAVGALTGEQTVEFAATVTAPDGVDVTVDQETLTLEPGCIGDVACHRCHRRLLCVRRVDLGRSSRTRRDKPDRAQTCLIEVNGAAPVHTPDSRRLVRCENVRSARMKSMRRKPGQ